ncbi:MAG: hypothetical protein DI536_09015 [Archangium gephyra]|uniref:DUF4386 domain-containing protein n=1 Tax=Archangium gephyra TaxID=48 RepID=A0A2W5VFN6_9BACT|nr:MAG: hypothetical protein DI536_09015 [Archangium gephyra]
MNQRRRDALLGLSFLLVFPAFGLGSALRGTPAGTVLVLLNSVLVVTLGALLWRESETTGALYFGGRLTEAVLLLINPTGETYQLAMASLALASIPFWWSVPHLAPRWLRSFGVIGYAVFFVGTQLELFGVRAGLWLSLPGGLFEVTMACWFLSRAWRGGGESGSATPA